MTEARTWRVDVPATLANLGPGFDRLGLAVARHLTVIAEPAPSWSLDISGPSADRLPRDDRNLMIRVIQETCGRMGWAHTPMRLEVHNRFPISSGMGSSAAAIVAALAIIHSHVLGSIDKQAIFAEATRLEGHPDNVAPAVFGGLCVCGDADQGTSLRHAIVSERIQLLVCTPEEEAETSAMRAVLPDSQPPALIKKHQQWVERLLRGIAEGRAEDLVVSEWDELHQPYRFKLLSRSHAIFDWMAAHPRIAGAFLSGSGPTVAGWLVDGHTADLEALQGQAHMAGIELPLDMLPVDRQGLTVQAWSFGRPL